MIYCSRNPVSSFRWNKVELNEMKVSLWLMILKTRKSENIEANIDEF
jgi:hypothetical protein